MTDYSHALGVYFLKNKSDTALCGTEKGFQSDNGGECISEEFKSLLLKDHIKHERPAP